MTKTEQRVNAARRLIDRVPQYQKALAGTHAAEFEGREYQAFLTGTAAFLLNPPLPGLAPLADGIKAPLIKYAVPNCGDGVDAQEVLVRAKEAIARYKADNRGVPTHKRPPTCSSHIPVGNTRLDPFLLVDVVKVLGGAVWICEGKSPLHPVRIDSKSGIAIIMPVRGVTA